MIIYMVMLPVWGGGVHTSGLLELIMAVGQQVLRRG